MIVKGYEIKPGVNLTWADLRDADLRGADLHRADLRDADLSDAHLRDADLHGAHLRCANLSRADLSGADLSRAYLRDADLSDADLRGADLHRADLRRADLRGAQGITDFQVGDLRRFRLVAVDQPDGTRVLYAGCRQFKTVEEAREHWGAAYEGDRAIGDLYLAALNW